MVNKLKSISFITGVASFLLVAGAVVLLFSSCGIANLQRTNTGANYGSEDAGKGETPKLASRLASNPSLADEDCEDNDRCKETCRDIYDETSSYKKCYNLSIQEVSNIEDVFYTLLSADADDLEDLDSDDLENYLRIGIDGWIDKLIPRQKQKRDNYDKFKRTLAWIVEGEKDIVAVLEKEDQDNEILKKLFLEYCDENSDHRCANDDSILHNATDSLTGQQCKLKITRRSGVTNCSHYTTQSDWSFTPPQPPNICETSLSGNFEERPLDIERPDKIELLVGGNVHFGSNMCPTPSDISGVPSESGAGEGYTANGVVFDYSSSDLHYCGYSFNPSRPESCSGNINIKVDYKQIAEVDEDEKELFIALAGVGESIF